jgi:DNA-binding NtrC family response regulator
LFGWGVFGSLMAKKGSVLVVDDEEIMRDVLETLLSAEGYRVDLAKTGEEGLDAYTKRPYDSVLLDVSMPGIGGLRALEEFLKLDSEAVVIMITAYATFDTAIAGLGERRVWVHSQTLFRTNTSPPRSPPA